MELRTLEFLARNVENARSEQQDLILVEAGCGTGNAVYPLLRANERLFAYAFDFSHRAVELLRSSPEYRPDRIHAFQANLIEPSTYLDIVRASSPRGAHFVTALWTLSALTPHEQSQAASGLASLLAYDGVLLVRDYAAGDMRAEKFAKRGQHVCREAERLFLRGDGTYAYFFTEDELRTLFENVGLSCISCKYEERTVENRKEGLTMRRRWVQARFKRNGGGEGG